MTRLGWYFSPEDKKLAHGDGREIAVGVTHEVDGDPVLCDHGLHASKRILDACQYATSGIVWRVKLSGKISPGYDKMCATRREYLAGGIDISDVLREFSRSQALSVAHLWAMPAIVRKYLETGDESIRSVAWSAAYSAARSAAYSAARSAAESAARSAAESAARSAAESAAWSAAYSAARSAAWSAAWSAAYSAARSAAWSAAEKDLSRRVIKKIRSII